MIAYMYDPRTPMADYSFRAEQCKSLKEMSWHCMDATKMSFGDSSIESAVDKGTLDSIMCRLDSADLAPVFFREVHRVLKPGMISSRLMKVMAHSRALRSQVPCNLVR